MSTTTLQKGKVTKAILAKAMQTLSEMPPLGNRSGREGSDARKVGDAIRLACLVAITTGKSVEITNEILPMVGESNEWHIAWSRVRTFEKVLGKVTFTVTMFTTVENETAATITGETATSKGHGRVFITPNA